MKKIIYIVLITLLTVSMAYAYTITSGVSINKVPKSLFGSWQVQGRLVETNAPGVFKPTSQDLWNLSRINNVLKLENPFTGAVAEVGLQTTEGNLVVFTKESDYENKVLKDRVALRLNNNTFTGINDLTLETRSIYDGHVIKKETARYRINGKKLSGNTLIK